MHSWMIRLLLIPLLAALAPPPAAARGVYQTPEDFLAEVFAGEVPRPRSVWLTGQVRETAQRILGHRPAALRARYWRRGPRTAWILEEIGKEKPITVGLVVDGGRLERIKVLVFRESRGWEVREPAFTRQFDGARLDDQARLDRTIDGITGATLSVRALTNLARLALFLHAKVMERDDTP